MAVIVLVIRLLLSAVFATAGFAKLQDRRSFSETVVAFGVPLRVARHAARLIPIAELLIAACLLVQPLVRWSALAAALLVLVFIGGIARALSQGRTPDCNCFGQLSAEQIGTRTLIRNGLLLAAAAVAVWKGPGDPLTGWTSSLAAANLVAAIAAIALALVGVLALQYRRRLLLALAAPDPDTDSDSAEDGLRIGQSAPAFELSQLGGERLSLESLLDHDLPVVVVFASPTCAPCSALFPELVRWGAALDERLKLVVVESGVPDPELVAEVMPPTGELLVLIEPERDVAVSFGVRGTPSAIAIDSSGAVASELALGAVSIENLVRSVVRQGGAPASPPRVAAR